MKNNMLIVFLVCMVCIFGCSKKTSTDAPSDSQVGIIDYRKLVSNADLVYNEPVSRSEEGMPVGNGRMGSLVWTTPTSLKMQINRVDVFAINKSTNSFPARHTDYASGCGYVDIHMVDYGEEIFTGDDFRQHLGLYDGVATAEGKGIKTRTLAWHERDVMAIEIEDQRQQPAPVNVDLRMLRYVMQYFLGRNYELSENHEVMIQTREHYAILKLDIRDGRIILTQKFREKDHYNASAVAISIIGRKSMARYLNESTVQLTAAPGKGTFTVMVASASSFNPEEDVADLALKELDVADSKGFDGLLASNKTWWHDFWSKSYVDLHSADGDADYVEQNYTYFQYVMASSSRGEYQPRYGGMIWYTTGDMREWGSQYWWHNQSCYYNSLHPTNRFELLQPMYSMYSKHIESYAMAARQQWGSKGIWLPETTWWDGQDEMPEDIAEEMRDLYLLRKPWEERSERFISYAEPKLKHMARYNWATVGRWENGHWIIPEKGHSPFGHVTHIFSATAQIAWSYWLRYDYTRDTEWLREYAYPVIRGAVEFYRNYPHVKKESDGKYHIYHTNNGEGVWDAHNGLLDISAMRGITPVLIRASEILGIDADMRPVWKEFADNIAPQPTSDLLDSHQEGQPVYWMSALPPEGFYGRPESPGLLIYYDLCTVGTEDTEMIRTGNATFDAIYDKGIDENTPVNVLTQSSLAAAYLGRGNDLKHMIVNQIKCLTPETDFCDWNGVGQVAVLPNRLTLREGPGSIDCQRLGNAAAGLHAGLLQSVQPAPGKDPVIYLFPAWPDDWDASYKLAARGAFLVSASIDDGEIGNVEIESQVGGECRLNNPWPGKAVQLFRNEDKSEEMTGTLITFSTQPGEIITIIPED
ncbi:MAG: glycoside hydrolase [Bacteroidales bacterium]|nr:glycoside hydrolase [Bacteroidales bacterium]